MPAADLITVSADNNLLHIAIKTLKAVQKHVTCKWTLLYIERWLTAPIEQNGIRIERTRGTPQGGVISLILSNLFLHYTFDLWMNRKRLGFKRG
jgi:retron-type reverse transcriptase